MSDIREVNAAHQPNDLQRRRDLHRLDKRELVNIIRGYETGIANLTARIDAYTDEP
ncbi:MULTISPECIES: hypothetical protein [unclassified Microbacterium]|uniref:hypothetical protein n=1 Tax=unclassified Microbacterium TaxID=2609290 RepID=UPI0015C9758A|nr:MULTISPECIES: hypothetical protein [unclassified Microbacterium]NYF29041.1 hypothetical protein [Microbacterium sp. JAI119]